MVHPVGMAVFLRLHSEKLMHVFFNITRTENGLDDICDHVPSYSLFTDILNIVELGS